MAHRGPSAAAYAILFERRVLFGCTALIGLAFLLWLVAVSTNYWFVIRGDPAVYINETKRYFVYSNSGIWRICRTTFSNATRQTTFIKECTWHDMFPSDREIADDPKVDTIILNYSRTEMSFAVISSLLMMMGVVFSVYTFKNPRYMFKRLAGGIHFITGGTILVVMEVMINSVEYEKVHLPVTHPPGSDYSYGFSFMLGWVVFAMYVIAGITFIVFSRKRKGSKAPTDEIAMADEPQIIGR